jgi:hypothetical protein
VENENQEKIRIFNTTMDQLIIEAKTDPIKLVIAERVMKDMYTAALLTFSAAVLTAQGLFVAAGAFEVHGDKIPESITFRQIGIDNKRVLLALAESLGADATSAAYMMREMRRNMQELGVSLPPPPEQLGPVLAREIERRATHFLNQDAENPVRYQDLFGQEIHRLICANPACDKHNEEPAPSQPAKPVDEEESFLRGFPTYRRPTGKPD